MPKAKKAKELKLFVYHVWQTNGYEDTHLVFAMDEEEADQLFLSGFKKMWRSGGNLTRLATLRTVCRDISRTEIAVKKDFYTPRHGSTSAGFSFDEPIFD